MIMTVKHATALKNIFPDLCLSIILYHSKGILRISKHYMNQSTWVLIKKVRITLLRMRSAGESIHCWTQSHWRPMLLLLRGAIYYGSHKFWKDLSFWVAWFRGLLAQALASIGWIAHLHGQGGIFSYSLSTTYWSKPFSLRRFSPQSNYRTPYPIELFVLSTHYCLFFLILPKHFRKVFRFLLAEWKYWGVLHLNDDLINKEIHLLPASPFSNTLLGMMKVSFL